MKLEESPAFLKLRKMLEEGEMDGSVHFKPMLPPAGNRSESSKEQTPTGPTTNGAATSSK